jgi:hypothetical protein
LFYREVKGFVIGLLNVNTETAIKQLQLVEGKLNVNDLIIPLLIMAMEWLSLRE